MTSDYSEQDDRYYEDLFKITLVERCRTVQTDAIMDLTSGGMGVFGNPYQIDMWKLLTIPMTTTTYTSGANDPNSYHRCSVYTTLHYNDS